MIDLTREFMICLAVAWSCFLAGVWAIRYSHCVDLVYLGRYLIALCPIVLSLFSSHSVSVCEQVILSKHSEAESVSERIYLTSISRADLGDGCVYSCERYSDGTARASGLLPGTDQRIERGVDGAEESTRGGQGSRRGLVPMQAQSEPIIDGADFRASVF